MSARFGLADDVDGDCAVQQEVAHSRDSATLEDAKRETAAPRRPPTAITSSAWFCRQTQFLIARYRSIGTT
jgi:hypothetical protein